MIDKNNIIITKNERIKTLLAFIKNNAVLVPIISFCAAVFTVGVNSFVYTYTISYFNYFVFCWISFWTVSCGDIR